MLKNKAFFILSVAGYFFSLSVFAQGNCSLVKSASPTQAKSYIQCLDSDINTAKRIRSTWIEKRTYELTENQQTTGNTQILPLFKKSLLSYDKFIEQSCQWRYILKMPNATKAAITYKHCEIALINAQIEQLKLAL
ncbi:DUF1311 domain-containing protein [Pseudoalteromonas sp. MMG010]|uniref:lysozyme inhibitor LprI family protein n=1 Tax=Pseudoalteromonas sp. MMG010 TaxID=2822685 RepID=UPI001B3A73D2|nr:lysozyme inhibitor LprI family protein [Pseudoalteromonas sp. MMG010]MBQ4832243.1 DUF1311 domain-containing protein [Pseudoalteromonas sp. MMG010]